jgi:RNA polymerase sigma-70 factor (ECF subfamily)
MIIYTPQFLESLQSKNEATFTKLYQDTVDMFYRFIKSHYMLPEATIQDILSETYIKIRNSLSNLDDSKKISSYLRTILKNTTKDYFKKTKEIAFSQFDNEETEESFESTIADPDDLKDLFHKEFQSEAIICALHELDEKFKEVIFLKFVEWYENQEISVYLDISEDNVRQRISRGLAKLRILLESNMDDLT